MRKTWLHPENDPKTGERPEVGGEYGPVVNAREIILRMREGYEVKTDLELSNCLNISKTAISSWRQRNSVPLDMCIKAAWESANSLDWMVFGGNKNRIGAGVYEAGIDVDIFSICVYYIDNSKYIKHLKDDWDYSTFRARFLIGYYAKFMDMYEDVKRNGLSSREDFLRSLRKNFTPEELPIVGESSQPQQPEAGEP